MRALLLLPLLLAVPAGAQPLCNAPREGMEACFAETLCLCRHEPGGSLTGRPPGYRWDCGALRPRCGVVPPDASGKPQQPPLLLMPPAWTPGRGPTR